MWSNFLTNHRLLKQFARVTYYPLMRKTASMAKVSVRNVPEEERIQITFTYPPDVGLGIKRRVFNFDRLKAEELEKTLIRITTNVSKQANKKKKKEKTDIAAEEVAVKLVKQQTEVDGLKSNAEAWEEGTWLQIADQSYAVQLNVPTVKSLTLPECILVGIPVYPRLVHEFAVDQECSFVWYRDVKNLISKKLKKFKKQVPPLQKEEQCTESSDRSTECKSSDEEQKSDAKDICRDLGNLTWDQIHVGSSYLPRIEDVGHLLKVECLPSDGSRVGNCVSTISKGEVSTGPGICPFEKRHRFTEQLMPPGSFRFVSYNILADCYADSEFARDFLFPYCPPDILNIDYRRQLLLKELQGYNADIVCLQEVDRKVFEYDLKPNLGKSGFLGLLKLKTGEVAEGTATFYRQSKFRLVEQHDLSMKQALLEDPLFEDIVDRVSKSPTLKEKLMERTAVLQVTLLESVDEPERKPLIVATVHLYFHPKAPHIRTIQTAVCIRHVERILEQLSKQGVRPAVIFCGDLNAYPEAGVHEFLTKKRIFAKHAEWFAGGKEEFVDGMSFSHSLDLVSACGYPRYTNYVGGYTGCLDYIYVESQRLQTLNVVPMPSHEDVTEHTALPNAVFPSDHIALVCELGWTNNSS